MRGNILQSDLSGSKAPAADAASIETAVKQQHQQHQQQQHQQHQHQQKLPLLQKLREKNIWQLNWQQSKLEQNPVMI